MEPFRSKLQFVIFPNGTVNYSGQQEILSYEDVNFTDKRFSATTAKEQNVKNNHIDAHENMS